MTQETERLDRIEAILERTAESQERLTQMMIHDREEWREQKQALTAAAAADRGLWQEQRTTLINALSRLERSLSTATSLIDGLRAIVENFVQSFRSDNGGS